jgi:hypothetical protein
LIFINPKSKTCIFFIFTYFFLGTTSKYLLSLSNLFGAPKHNGKCREAKCQTILKVTFETYNTLMPLWLRQMLSDGSATVPDGPHVSVLSGNHLQSGQVYRIICVVTLWRWQPNLAHECTFDQIRCNNFRTIQKEKFKY